MVFFLIIGGFMNTTILVCDDNIAVHESLSLYLNEANMSIISVYDGESALDILQRREIHLVILDLMLPGKSGIEVLKEMKFFSDVPVICLSAKDSEFDRVLGLELGAEDYITKPFYPREVIARIQKILNRMEKKKPGKKIQFANLVIDQNSYKAFLDDKLLELTPKELNLLALFAQNPGIVLTRERILNSIWGYDYYSDSRVVDTQVKKIRHKLPNNALFEIRSVYGVGYIMELK